ncbi:MAG: redoxin domain-containing protein [Candidatus Porifericomitaceae bacterium WSBS_2022_MAG_OTU9]
MNRKIEVGKKVGSRVFHLFCMIAFICSAPVQVSHAAESTAQLLLPQFTQQHQQDWINSKPLKLSDLKGKVVLIDFWTFECWNCYRSFPWLRGLEQRLAPKGLQVIGVHTPEFEHEKVRANVVAKVKEFGLDHPVMLDNEFTYWRAMNNRYWPTFYVVDAQGKVRGKFIGETHEGGRNAVAMETLINELLNEI